ncbi:hypothetical protein Ancab_025349 [Ancistrocladus abbreviatus]
MLENRILDPLVHGDYPAVKREYIGSTPPTFSTKEAELPRRSLDVISINQYSTFYAINCFHSSYRLTANCLTLGYVDVAGFRDDIPIGGKLCTTSSFPS